MPQIQMRDICVDCTEEFVSNEVIRAVLPTRKLEREPFYIIELNSWIPQAWCFLFNYWIPLKHILSWNWTQEVLMEVKLFSKLI